MPLTSTDGGGPGLHLKPLDAVIGQVFTPYCPGERQGSHSEKIAAMAKINTPQWNKPMVGSPQDSTGRWFDTQINYWYGLGGVEAVMKEV